MFKFLSNLYYNRFYCDQVKSPVPLDHLLTEIFAYSGRDGITRIACVCIKWRDLTETKLFNELMWENQRANF